MTTQKRARLYDRLATTFLYATAAFFILLLAALTLYILYKGVLALQPEFISFSGEGIGIQLFNTVYLVMIALLISVPIGIATGVYLAEYAKRGILTDIIRICIETLSSLPSIVVGLFGFLVLIVLTHSSWNLFAGSLAVSILNIPLIARVTEDALRSVPISCKEGSYGVGATQWQTITKTMIPVSIPRIATGIILAAGRGFGEAAALIYTAGMTSDISFTNWDPASPTSPLNPFRPADTLAVHIWALKAEGISPNADRIADLSAAVLVVLIFAFSLGSRLVSRALEKRCLGKS